MNNPTLNKEKSPLVSIDCLTFNHGPYIRDTLEGFLNQRTIFKFEVLVHDDASTDNTAEIIREYGEKYPDVIKPIYQSENQYSKGISISKTFQCPRAKGKYYAMCEGDDYWTDPYKLQKQVDFLEMNPEYGLVHGNIDKLYNKTGKIRKNTTKINKSQYSTMTDVFNGLLLNKYQIATLTVLTRKELIYNAFDSMDLSNHLMGDLPTWLELSQKTRFHFLPETVGVYRKISGSASNTQESYFKFIDSGLRIRIHFANKYNASKNVIDQLNSDYYKNQLKIAFYSNDVNIAQKYFNGVNSNGFDVSFLDSIIYKSINNNLLYIPLKSIADLKDRLVGMLKWILRINVY